MPARRRRYDFFSGPRRTQRSSLGAHASSVVSASKIPARRMRALPAGRAEILSKKQRILGLVVRSSPAAALRLREIPSPAYQWSMVMIWSLQWERSEPESPWLRAAALPEAADRGTPGPGEAPLFPHWRACSCRLAAGAGTSGYRQIASPGTE